MILCIIAAAVDLWANGKVQASGIANTIKMKKHCIATQKHVDLDSLGNGSPLICSQTLYGRKIIMTKTER